MTGHWRKPLDFSEEAMAAAAAQVASLRNALRGETRTAGDWEELAAALDDDFNTPAALALFHAGRGRGARRAPPRPRGLRARGARRAGRRAGRGRRRSPRASRCPRAARLRRVRPAARRDRSRGWEIRDTPGDRASSSSAAVTRDLVYGRNAVREALRGRREVLELWVSERAAGQLDWLDEGPRPQSSRSAS